MPGGSGAKSALWLVQSFVCESDRTRGLKLDSVLIRNLVWFLCSVQEDHAWRGAGSDTKRAPQQWPVDMCAIGQRRPEAGFGSYSEFYSMFSSVHEDHTWEGPGSGAVGAPLFVCERSDTKAWS